LIEIERSQMEDEKLMNEIAELKKAGPMFPLISQPRAVSCTAKAMALELERRPQEADIAG